MAKKERGPWEDYAPAAPAQEQGPWTDYGDEGLTGSVSAIAPTVSGGGANTLQALRDMTRQRVPAAEIKTFMAANGITPTRETEAWLNSGEYDAMLAAAPKGDSVDIEWRPHKAPETNILDAARRGMLSGAARGWDDEIIAGIDAPIASLMNDKSIGQNYDEMAARLREQKQTAFDQHPFAYGAGFIPGAAVGLGKGEAAGTTLGNLMRWFGRGAAEGAVSGAGNADGDNVFGSALGGALIGGPAGVIAYPIAQVASSVFGRVLRRVAPDSETGGLAWLSEVAPQDANAMGQQFDELAAAGVPPRLLDVVDESGRGVIRDAASKMTPGRTAVTQHADNVYAGMQDRVVDQARRNISGAPRTAREMAGELTTARDDAMEQAMGPLRALPVGVTDRMAEILGTREGQAALRGAEGLMTDPADREAVRNVMAAVNMMRQIDPRMPPKVRQQIINQLFADAKFTVDMADKFARAMRGRAAKTPGLERVARDFSNAIRDEARGASPDYDQALNDYAARSDVINILNGEAGSFMSTPADMYAPAVQAANPVAPAGTGMSAADAMRVRARDEVVDRATQGGGAQAAGTARQLAFGGGETGAGQRARSAALLGEQGADDLAAGMRAETSRLRNTEYVDPRRGSQTHGRSEDAAVDGFVDATVHASGGMWGIVREVGRWLRRGGIKGVDAERLSRDAISQDPARVRAAIDFLAQRGMRRDNAQRFVDALVAHGAGRAAGATQGTPKREPINSVQALRRPAPVGGK